ncbi:MAG: hypothetical protein HOP09_04800 [Hyphomicrobium sp.]|nr:hypothetical protein [Hyphomicrobium sp.]
MSQFLLSASVILAFSINTARAEDFATQDAQPLCVTMDDLQKYTLAGMLQDRKAEWECVLVPKDMRLRIEKVVKETDIGNIVIARVFAEKGGTSAVGYTWSIGLKPYK